MITRFLLQQLDYIYFFYGFSFILLAVVCNSLRKEPGQRLPWTLLGLFGVTHGVKEWLDMLALELGDGGLFSAVRLGLLALSFVFLLEFGRKGSRALTGKGPGGWVHGVLLLCLAAGGLAGFAGLTTAVRYAFGLTGFLWAALALFRAYSEERASRRELLTAAILAVLYALASGVSVPKSAFFPATVVNQEAFLSATGLPIQLVRGILALLITFSLWMHYERLKRQGLPQGARADRDYLGNRVLFSGVLALILIMGLVFAGIVTRDADREVRLDLLNNTRMAAASLDPDKVRLLAGTADATTPEYRLLRGQLLAMGRSTPQLRWIHLMSLRDGKVMEIVDSVPVGVYGHSEPGDTSIHDQPPVELFAVFAGGKPATVGPYTDEWGTCISGFAPVIDPATGRVVGVLGADIDAVRWHGMIAKYRLASLAITLLVALMTIVFFMARLRGWENALRLAASQDDLAEAQAVARVGHWTLNTSTNRVTWSEEMFRIYGIDPAREALPYVRYRELIHPEDRARVDDAARQMVAGEGAVELEYRLIRPDGAIRHVLSKARSARGTRGVIQVLGTLQDITERTKAEQELRALHKRIEFVLGVTRTGFDIIDAQFTVVYVDPAWQEIYGEYQGKKCYDYFAGRNAVCPHCCVPEALRTRKAVVGEETLPKEGNRRVQVTTIPFQNEDGEWLVAEVNVDITARKMFEQALQESMDRFSQVSEVAGEWIWEVDAQGLYRYSSPAVEKILGYLPGELVGSKHFYDLFHPDRRAEMKAGAMAAFGRHESFSHYINPNVHKNGTAVLLETSAVPILDERGNLLGYRGTDTDITQRERAREEVATAKAFLDSIINAIADPVFVKDAARRFVLVNDALCAMVGRSREGLLGVDGDDLFPGEQVEVFRKVDTAVLETGQANVNEEQLSDLSTGQVHTIVTHKSRYTDPGGKRFIVGVIRDFTERKRAEAEQERLFAELTEAMSKVQLLSGFLPICASCKRIRDDKGYWNQIESYIRDHSEAEFSHGLCPECMAKLYPEDAG